MKSRLRTPRSDLERLPQFEPDHTFRLDETQHESGLPFPESRARQIRDVLSSATKDHVREARFQGKSTSLERFLRNAMLAIATYESRSLRRRPYDRGRASKLLKEVRVALWAFQRALEGSGDWKQLDRYLTSLFVAARKQNERQRVAHAADSRPDATVKRRVRALLEARKLVEMYRAEFRARSPRGILNQLRHLEALLSLALEKLELQPGDVQRDEIAREFASAMMFAWMSATGVVPTISKSKPLPFQRLLATINRDLLKAEVRHPTDFRYPAVFAADRARKRDKGENLRP
jgi:hypothetical protein